MSRSPFLQISCCKIAAHHAEKTEQLLYKFRSLSLKYGRKKPLLCLIRALKPHSRVVSARLSAVRKLPALAGMGLCTTKAALFQLFDQRVHRRFRESQSQQICFCVCPSPSFSAESSHSIFGLICAFSEHIASMPYTACQAAGKTHIVFISAPPR